jgi:molybdenum cofactor cytidylyltransferase
VGRGGCRRAFSWKAKGDGVIPALILAAGRSERMGRSKALLPCAGGESFVSRLVDAFRRGGAEDVLVVARTGDDALAAEVLRCDARVIENPDADRGQLSSIVVGVNAADRPGVAGVFVMPVDIPLVRPDTIAHLRAAFIAGDAPIARASYRGRNGHPVIFGRRVFDDLRRADPSIGAKAVMHAHADAIMNVDVDDEMTLRDIDTPDDYDSLIPHR